MDDADTQLRPLYERLLRVYGPQGWWPAQTPFEVMVGAVLTQNTAWTNVEKAIARLAQAQVLELEALLALSPQRLGELIRPAGFYNIKASRLLNLCHWYRAQGGEPGVARIETSQLRQRLLGVNGIGPETADAILLYAWGRRVFVIDAYTRRIFSRIGLCHGESAYESLRHWFEQALGPDRDCYQEYHALIVTHAKTHCRVRPRCRGCPLEQHCAHAL